jgi:hypothetical protein
MRNVEMKCRMACQIRLAVRLRLESEIVRSHPGRVGRKYESQQSPRFHEFHFRGWNFNGSGSAGFAFVEEIEAGRCRYLAEVRSVDTDRRHVWFPRQTTGAGLGLV